jgi:serine/threonine-protein kinase
MSGLPAPFGPYVLLKALGTGGGGDVFLARPRDRRRGLPEVVVIKRLHGRLAEEGDFVRRFRHEAEIAVSVSSPHLVKCYDAGMVGEVLYIAMEYVAGWPLSRMLKELRNAKHRASLHSVGDIIGGALQGLEALHSARHQRSGVELGIVHRDIAPKNIMVGEDGITRLIDLGIGKSSMQDWKTGTGVIMGSPGYMAPEQVAGEKIDQRVDLYAMGIVLWELLTLKNYFDRTTFAGLLRAQHKPNYTPPSKYAADLPPAMDELCARALSPVRDHRFATAAEFLAALRLIIPERDEQQPLATVVGEMLIGELGQSKTEVFRLLAARMNSAPEIPAPVVVLAEREGILSPLPMGPLGEDYEDPLGPTLHTPEEIQINPVQLPPDQLQPEAMTPLAFPTPYSMQMVPPRSGVPLKVVLPLMALTLVLGIGGTAVVLDQRRLAEANEVQQITAEPQQPQFQPAPSIAPSVEKRSEDIRAEETPVEHPGATEDRDPERRRERRAVREDKEPKTERVVERRVEAVTTTDPKELVNALIARVRAAKSKAETGSAAEKDAMRLMTKLSMEAARPDLDSARASALENEVRDLEKGL